MTTIQQQMEAPIFGSRKFWSSVTGSLFLIITYVITKSDILAVVAAAPFVGNVLFVAIQNMMTIKYGTKTT